MKICKFHLFSVYTIDSVREAKKNVRQRKGLNAMTTMDVLTDHELHFTKPYRPVMYCYIYAYIVTQQILFRFVY